MAFYQTSVAGSYLPVGTITTVMREDLQEMVYILDPYETSFQSMLEIIDVDSPVVNWIGDRLPGLVLNNTAGSIDVDGVNINGLIEDADPSFSGSAYTGQPERDVNFVQMFAGKIAVSDFLKQGRIAGIRDPYNNDLLKVTKVLGKAWERRCFDNLEANASYLAGSNGVTRRMHPLYEFISGGGAGAMIPINQVTAAGTLGVTAVDAAMETTVTTGGMPEYLFTSVGSKLDFSISARQSTGTTLSSINQSFIAAQEKKILRQVDIYHGEYGPLAVVMNRQIPQSSSTTGGGKAWLFQRDMLAQGRYLPIQHVPLAKTGFTTKGIVVGASTIIVKWGGAHCMINQVTT